MAAAKAEYKVDGHPFNPQDLSGIWGNNGIDLDLKALPSFTPLGQQMFEATRAPEAAPGITATNVNDPMLICDPLGYPRWFTYNYGFEFVMLPDRVLQFFELGHTWRTIWTDGRKLPTNPPQQRWLGYAVGRWEGDTFIVDGSTSAVWIAENGVLFIPPAPPAIPSVSVAFLRAHAQRASLEIRVEPLTWDRFEAADEAFLTNAFGGAVPIRGRGGDLFARVARLFAEAWYTQ
jgi:hypothetical protein